ncbi:unnamed protein product [Arctogadus glacialis]
MSTGVKKPPLAPKPKLPATTKPSPPPIAPKPGLLSLAPAVHSPAPSPGTLPRAKPALAPKPCVPVPQAKPAAAHTQSQEHSDGSLDLLNTPNGSPSSPRDSLSEADYILPACRPGGLESEPASPPLLNGNHGNVGNNGSAACDEEGLHNGNATEGPVGPVTTGEGGGEVGGGGEEEEEEEEEGRRPQEEEEEKGEAEEEEGRRLTDSLQPKPRDKPQRQKHLARGRTGREGQGSPGAPPQQLQETETGPEPEGRLESEEEDAAPHQEAGHEDTALAKKPVLVRQDGLEGGAEGPPQGPEVGGGPGPPEADEGPADGEPPSEPERDPTPADEEPDAPVPPPRQTSLSHRHKSSSLHRHAPRSVDPPAGPGPRPPAAGKRGGVGEGAGGADEEQDGGYGDFERYPAAHSLPKHTRLGCGRRALSAEGQDSPRAPPRKPQRHSLPAPPPPPVSPPGAAPPPPAPPHAGAPTRDLPAPPLPQERAAGWRFPRPSVSFFSRQAPGRSSVPPPQGRAPPPAAAAPSATLGGKQRAQSFSAADLSSASREPANPRRSISFRKLLELRISVKRLPKRLSRAGGASPEGSAPNAGEVNGGREKGGGGGGGGSDADASSSGDGSVEYENVPLYEEIPEYMNLPFHGARLGAPQDGDGEIYEVQDPYLTALGHRYDSGWLGQDDVHSEEDEVHSSDEDDDSSSSSKEHHEVVDRQQEDEMKRKKVVHIAQEIMSSEKVFVDVLELLHIDFRDAVAKATRQNGKPVVEERVLSQILYYLPQLYQLNRDLLRELEDRVAHWADHQRLADIFVQKGPYLKMYSTYIRQFDNNVALLDEQCRKNPAFVAVVREFETSPRCASLALKHYLLKPVQRIPQYQLLLTDYLKNLPEDSEDYKDTQAALSIVKEVANHANDIMKQGDNFQKLMQIQYSLNGHHEIVQPGRVFLKEGTLMKLSRKEMQPRMFFLFNDALMYTTPVQSAQYKLNSVLSLAGMKVSKPSQEAYQNELNIESVERSFILSASSATEREQWLEAIAKAIDDYTKKKITFISSRSQDEPDMVPDIGAPLGSKAPIWIPDLRATMCMMCTCEFTLTWRRHHCRACGKVVCQACSTNKFYLEYLKNQPARVCDHCFTKLQENSDRCASTSVSPIGKSAAFSFSRKHKKIPAALKEVSANTENTSMSGYLNRSKGSKRQWKRLWFVVKDKVLYTYAASEDVAALESLPLLGFFLREEKYGPAQRQQFKLYHKNTLFYIFKADDVPSAQRWIEAFQEAMILEE